MATTQPIRNPQEIKALSEYYLIKGQLRNYVLIMLGLHTALRISDMLRLTWGDVYDFERHCFRSLIEVVEKKTGKSKIIALNMSVTSALSLFFKAEPAEAAAFLLENARTKKAISRVQAYRLIRAASEALELEFRVSCHSLRKTFGYHAWKQGTPPAVIMDIYNHSSLEVTKRYLGITQDDRNEVYLNIELIS